MTTKTILFTVIVLLGLCSFTADANLSKQLELQLDYSIFKDWMTQFNKPYGIEELAIRFMNWKTNFDMVQQHNAKNLGWQLAMNDFGDQTPEEFSALHMGFNVNLDTRKDRNSTQTYTDDDDDNEVDTDNDNLLFGASSLSAARNATVNKTKAANKTKTKNNTAYALPKSVDWRKEGAVSSVKNQGRCGGCYSFAASGALEGLYAIKNKKLINLSVQQMIDCSSAYGNNGCDGGLMTNSFEYTQRFGVETETGYGYTQTKGECKQNSKKAVFRNKGYREVPSNNVSALKRAVAKQPVSVGIEASSMTIQLYKNGIISSECGTALDHAVLIVGYGAAKNGQEYWIVKNSWGEGWGQKGYMNIAMGNQNKGAGLCGINMMASYPTL